MICDKVSSYANVKKIWQSEAVGREIFEDIVPSFVPFWNYPLTGAEQESLVDD